MEVIFLDIEIEVIGKGKINAILDERNPKTARIIYENLPLEGEANIWLEEIYFDVPLKLDYENRSSTTTKGDAILLASCICFLYILWRITASIRC